MLKKMIMLSVLCSFGMFGSESFANSYRYLCQKNFEAAGGQRLQDEIDTEKVVMQAVLGIGNGLVGKKISEAVISGCDDTKPVNMPRYQPTQKEIARFVCTAIEQTVISVASEVIVNWHQGERMKTANMKPYDVSPQTVALVLAHSLAQEGLYRLICAEVHKHDALAVLQPYFPESNDPYEQEKLGVIGKHVVPTVYTWAYGCVKNQIGSLIPKTA